MPTPKDGESEQDFVSRCIPMVMDEGTASDQEQASAICYAMFKEHMSSKAAHTFAFRKKDMMDMLAEMPADMQDKMKKCMADKMDGGEMDESAAFAACKKEMEPAGDMPMDSEKTLVAFGGEVKALGDGRVGGYLVRFGDADNTDLEGDFFTPETEFGPHKQSPVFYQHALDPKLGARVLSQAELKQDEFGVWAETQLQLRDQYEQFIYRQVEAGKMGWSSGTASHLIERTRVGKAHQIKRWLLGIDASLTPAPAEYRNQAISLKSFKALAQDLQAEPEAGIPIPAAQATVTASNATTQVQVLTQNAAKTAKEPNEMEVTEFKSIIGDALAPLTERLDKVETALKAEPPVNGNGGTAVTVTRDESDVPFKSIAANAQAVKDYELSGKQRVAPRLKYLLHETEQAWKSWKATGASEGVPTDGGILLDPTLSDTFLMPVHQEGVFTSKVQRMPVSANSNYGWINGIDETSRVAGSRWGGVRGYRIAEGGTKTASKPRFRRLNWELKKYACLVYGTDELLADSAQFATVVNKACAEELSFMLNDDIFEGIGLAGAQGVMNSGALITVTRTTGSSILHSDIVNMYYRMDLNSRATAEWYVSNEASIQLDALYFTGSTSVLSPFVSYDANGVKRLYGRPVNVTEFGQAVNTTGDILFADFSQYLLWQKADIESATSIHVQFITDETAFRFVLRADGQSSQYSALTPFHGSTTTSPWVCLSTAT